MYYTIDGKKKLYFDVDKPELVVDGSIWAREIYLGSDHTNIIEYCSDDSRCKISGEVIEGRGLGARDRSDDLRIEIDGYDGSAKIYDGYIYLTNGTNKININADEGLTFTSNGNEVVKLNIQNGDATFSGTVSGGKIISNTTINVTTDATIGETLKIVNGDNGDFFFTISAGGITGDRICLQAANQRPIEIDGGAIYLEGSVYANGDKVATQSDLDDLQKDIGNLKKEIASLKSSGI